MRTYQLTPEQRRAVEHACDMADGRKVTAISGPAGSGKTLVAMEIAERLSHPAQLGLGLGEEDSASQRLYLVTYTNKLCEYVRKQLGLTAKHTDDGYGNLMSADVEVLTVHMYLQTFLRENHFESFKLDNRRMSFLEGFVRENRERLELDGCLADAGFLAEEIGWLLGRGIRSKGAYLEVERTGRKTRLSKGQREKVFAAYRGYMMWLGASQGKVIDFDDIGNQVLHHCEERPCHPIAKHLIVDEVQDLPRTWIDALRKTVSPGGKIVLTGDTGQSIYGRGFTWKEAIGERARPIHLTEDFRNTRQIYEAARSLMDFDDTSDADASDRGQRRPVGVKPQLFLHPSLVLQRLHIQQLVERSKQEGGSIAIAFPRHNREFESEYGDDPDIIVTTLHSLKGLEADHVILASLDADQLDFGNEYTQEDTDRHLLYVGMTRAKRTLVLMCASTQPAWVLSELDFSLIDVHAKKNPEAYRNLAAVRNGRREQARNRFEAAVDEAVRAEAEVERAQQAEGRGGTAAGRRTLSRETARREHAVGLPDAAPQEGRKASPQGGQVLRATKTSQPAQGSELVDGQGKLFEQLKREVKRLQEKLRCCEEELRIYRLRDEAADKAVAGTLHEDAAGSADELPRRRIFVDDAKILILGLSSGVKAKDIPGIFKQVGLPRDAFEALTYDDVSAGKFNPRTLLDNVNYSDIFVGTTPHKAQGIEGASSLVEWLRTNRDDLPKLTVFQESDGKLKPMSKTDLKEALYKSDLYAARKGM